MNPKKCDRCRSSYEPYQPDAALKHSNMLIFAEDFTTIDKEWTGDFGYYERRAFELCPDCMADAVKFMQALMGGD